MIALVAALDENNGIGFEGWMPWNIPEDLKGFKALTMGGKLIMGRKTYVGIGRPLPGRTTYVVSRDFTQPGVEVINDLESFLWEHQHDDTMYYVCGGAQIYQQALPYCQWMYLSHVKGVYPADTYFPTVDYGLFEIVEQEEFELFTRVVYRRKK